jgi:hypothetical protein
MAAISAYRRRISTHEAMTDLGRASQCVAHVLGPPARQLSDDPSRHKNVYKVCRGEKPT